MAESTHSQEYLDAMKEIEELERSITKERENTKREKDRANKLHKELHEAKSATLYEHGDILLQIDEFIRKMRLFHSYTRGGKDKISVSYMQETVVLLNTIVRMKSEIDERVDEAQRLVREAHAAHEKAATPNRLARRTGRGGGLLGLFRSSRAPTPKPPPQSPVVGLNQPDADTVLSSFFDHLKTNDGTPWKSPIKPTSRQKGDPVPYPGYDEEEGEGPAVSARVCGYCGEPAQKACGGCLKVRYCSKECQAAHFYEHECV